MIQDVSNRLMRDFADCLQKNLESRPAAPDAEAGSAAAAPDDGPPVTGQAAPGEPAPFAPAGGGKPVSGLRLLFGALMDRLRRLFGREGRNAAGRG